MDYPKIIVWKQKEESISIQRVKGGMGDSSYYFCVMNFILWVLVGFVSMTITAVKV